MRTGIRFLCGLLILFAIVVSQEDSRFEEPDYVTTLDAKVDNLLLGYNEESYQVFSRDFDQELLSTLTEAHFTTEFRRDIADVLGKYKSREIIGVKKTRKITRLSYRTIFATDESVLTVVSFRRAFPRKIAGFYFLIDEDSPL